MGRNRKNKGPTKESGERKEDELEKYLEMKTSDVLGRYLVAKEDIQPGTVILKVASLVVGPNQLQEAKPLCLACYAEILDLTTTERCDLCGWPLCSTKCKGVYRENGHSEVECNTLKKSQRKPDSCQDNYLYNILLPLRVALLKSSSPQKWAEVQKMQSHTKFRKKNKTLWNNNQEMIDCMKKECGINDFSDQELHTIFGYLQVNSFAIEHLGLSGLYPKVFLIAHDCVPNTTHIINTELFMTVRAATLICKGELVTLSYANTFQGTLARRNFLKEAKYFNCICKRCSDTTELGTYLSAVKCNICKRGYLLPVDPLDKKSIWRCPCSEEKNIEYITSLLERISDEVDNVKNKGIEEMESFLRNFSSILHPNHYLLISVKCLLSQVYGKLENYLLPDLSSEMLNRKIELCKNLLQIFDVIEPGLSRIRGITMYELHAPLMIVASQKYQCRKVSEKLFKSQLKQVQNLLTDARLILSFEDPFTKEGQIGNAAKQALDETKQWERHFGKL